jgi:DNA primase
MNNAEYETWVAKARRFHIEDVLNQRDITLKRQGKTERVGPCPKCGGDDRFAINISKQVFNCRGCGASGDVIELVKFLDGVDFNVACETLTNETPPKVARLNGKSQGRRRDI